MYTKKFEYEDEAGNKQTLYLKPLKVSRLGDLWKVVRAMKIDNTEAQVEAMLEVMTKENVDILSSLCLDTVKRSSNFSDEEADYFTSSHFMELFPLVIALNLNPKDKLTQN